MISSFGSSQVSPILFAIVFVWKAVLRRPVSFVVLFLRKPLTLFLTFRSLIFPSCEADNLMSCGYVMSLLIRDCRDGDLSIVAECELDRGRTTMNANRFAIN
jgi:hypothetical protein